MAVPLEGTEGVLQSPAAGEAIYDCLRIGPCW